MKTLLICLMTLAFPSLAFVGYSAYDGGACNAPCSSCGRSFSGAHIAQCNISVVWLPAQDADGCCPAAQCTARDCVWNGDLSVKNLAANNVQIDIYGPGAVHTCLVVAPNGLCQKTFGGGGAPVIEEACGDDDTVNIDVTSGGGNVCQASITFLCAACPN